MSRHLKRKCKDSDEDQSYSSSSSRSSSSSSPSVSKWDSEEENYQGESPDWSPIYPPPHPKLSYSSILKRTKTARMKGNVRFDSVTVFLFQRCQGFTSVPSHGGCSLGMVRRHLSCQRYSLAEHRAEQRRQRREKLQDRLREERLEALKQTLLSNGTLTTEDAERLTMEDITEEELALKRVDEEEEEDEEEGYLPHSYSSKQRRRLLQRAGVLCIEREEKRQLQELRRWREDCGCHCQGFCEPLTCACSLAGIKCQMDRSSFPCGCTKDSCGNPAGRMEFNAGRVQTHYIHTLMKLELERRLRGAALQGRSQTGKDEEEQEGKPGSQDCCRGSFDDTLSSLEICTAPYSAPLFPAPAFLFGAKLTAEGENSCSSDMTDSSSCSSVQSKDLDNDPGPQFCLPRQGTDDRGLAHVLSFGESDEEFSFSSDESDCCLRAQTQLKGVGGFGSLSMSVFLDENANQTGAMCPCDVLPDTPNTPSPSTDETSHSYMDLSLSSDSDLDFFNSLHDYHSSPVHSHLKEHSYLNENVFCLANGPSLPQGEDLGTQLLESLIGVA
ncbi:hypothetical protein AALO_G00019220 [Alosa alosa]|uniref:Cysteine/serine-rich nuclear protein N-terminal domain-containing protein n=1 Tax=Alosa alosa TaxID=278164 RepID=A0AAV6HHZ1_9TELE|nr:cysteine/serine-rich nuclear protein 1-like [Alosa alosa]KAG5286828.1 hypothetical protein AALO_G00019220 [Alosa alosa]